MDFGHHERVVENFGERPSFFAQKKPSAVFTTVDHRRNRISISLSPRPA